MTVGKLKQILESMSDSATIHYEDPNYGGVLQDHTLPHYAFTDLGEKLLIQIPIVEAVD